MRIAISGKIKSGKSTLAWFLERNQPNGGNYSSCIYSFADPIRTALQDLGITKEEHPALYRAGAQYIGTDLCRAYDADWWTKNMAHRLRNHSKSYPVIIDDMRFQNEYDWCRENGFVMVRLEISPEEQLTRGAGRGTLDHASETGLDHIWKDEWDIWFSQSTTVDERVRSILSYTQRASQSPNG